MKSAILVSRIMQYIESEGALGNGEALAKDYAAAVNKVNTRLEAVLDALDSGQLGDAVRIKEESPRLMDEASALDFRQFDDWANLCKGKDWPAPPKIANNLLERLLMLEEKSQETEPLLKMYRAASLSGNDALAATSLRRLAKIDHSRDWLQNLATVENTYAQKIAGRFLAAEKRGDNAAMTAAAEEFENEEWFKDPACAGLERIRTFLAKRDTALREAIGKSCIEALKNHQDGNWKLAVVSATLKEIYSLAAAGWTTPAGEAAFIATCRERVEREETAIAFDKAWRVKCADLHAATLSENILLIHSLLADSVFAERPPEAGLEKDALRVLKRARRRAAMKRFMIALAIFAMFGAAGAFAVHKMKANLVDERCRAAVTQADDLKKSPNAPDKLAEFLATLEKSDPEICADARIAAIKSECKQLLHDRDARRKELDRLTARLEKIAAAGWIDYDTAALFDAIDKTLHPDDAKFKTRRDELFQSWNASAKSVHSRLQEEIDDTVARLEMELPTQQLVAYACACQDHIAAWKSLYSKAAPDIGKILAEQESVLADAIAVNRRLAYAMEKLEGAQSAAETIAARDALLKDFSSYPFIAGLKPLEVGAKEAEAAIANNTPAHDAFLKALDTPLNDGDFKRFVNKLRGYSEQAVYYSLYGLRKEGANKVYKALCIGRPKFERVGRDFFAKGDLFDLDTMENMSKITGIADKYDLVPSAKDFREVVDQARIENITRDRLAALLLKKVAQNLKEASKEEYQNLERKLDVTTVAYGRYPAFRRLQFVKIYLFWLRDKLKAIPEESALYELCDEIESLAQPVRVDGVKDALSWCCMRVKQIRQRNQRCAIFLANMAKAEPLENLKKIKAGRAKLRSIADWRVTYAGKRSLDSAAAPADAALYVLRKTGGRLRLAPASEAQPGEALYQVFRGGKAIDAEAEAKKILDSLEPKQKAKFASLLPLL